MIQIFVLEDSHICFGGFVLLRLMVKSYVERTLGTLVMKCAFCMKAWKRFDQERRRKNACFSGIQPLSVELAEPSVGLTAPPRNWKNGVLLSTLSVGPTNLTLFIFALWNASQIASQTNDRTSEMRTVHSCSLERRSVRRPDRWTKKPYILWFFCQNFEEQLWSMLTMTCDG